MANCMFFKSGGLHKDASLRHVIFGVMSDVTELFFDE